MSESELRTRRLRVEPKRPKPIWRVVRWLLLVLLALGLVAAGAVGALVYQQKTNKPILVLPSTATAERPSGAPNPSASPGTLPVVTDKEAIVPGVIVRLANTIVSTLLSLNPLNGTSQAGAWPTAITTSSGGEGTKCNLEVIQGTPKVYPCAVNGKATLYVYEQRLNVLIKNGDATPVAAEVLYAFGNLVDKRAANTSSAKRDACFAGIAATALHKSGFLDDAAYNAVAAYLRAKGGDKAAGFQRGLSAKTC
ncbi:MAG TPA: hypothetical protein VLA88_04830 [Candidatus Saccharimonadales bacterium]|nr:hypothetical protein [Candidatus Saccharimonadales bacterium]